MTKADVGLEPIFDTIWTAGNAVVDEVVNPVTMFPPKYRLDRGRPWTARSGAMAPLNAYRLASVMSPDWNRALFATSISYQRHSAPAPPKMVWPVHRATDRPWLGSIAETAWVSRPSRVSMGWIPFI